jgi:tetratricopeptide (TPR) repeat protein
MDRDEALAIARQLSDEGRYRAALSTCRRLLADDPTDVRVLLKLGDLHLKLDEHHKAMSAYERVGEQYYREGRLIKAVAVYKQMQSIIARRAPRIERLFRYTLLRLGEIYEHLGLVDDAVSAYEDLGQRLRGERREEDACAHFARALELAPDRAILHVRVAESRVLLGDVDAAVAGLDRAAQLMIDLGRRDDALKLLETLIGYRIDAAQARLAAELYLERGSLRDTVAAVAKLELCYRADREDLATLSLLARAFDQLGDGRKALAVLKESARVALQHGDQDTYADVLDLVRARAPGDPLVTELEGLRDLTPGGIPEDSSLELGDEDFETLSDLAPVPMASHAGGDSMASIDVELCELAAADAAAGRSLDEEALDRAEYLAESGHLGEARTILLDQLARMPRHQLVLDRLAEIDTLIAMRPDTSQPRFPAPLASAPCTSWPAAASWPASDSIPPDATSGGGWPVDVPVPPPSYPGYLE